MYTQITKKTFDLIFEKKYILMKALLIPFILLSILEYFNNVQVKETIGSANLAILVLASLLITLIMSISIHRILLLDESATPTWGIYKLGHREVSFALKAIGFVLLLSLISIGLFLIGNFISSLMEVFVGSEILSYIQIALTIILLIFIGVLFSRYSLVFPAIAIDKKMDFSDAFEISKDYKLFIFISVIIIPSILGLIVGFVYGLAIGFLMGLISEKLSVLLSLLNIFITVFTIGFLSTTYEFIMSKQPEKNDNINTKLKDLEYQENENSYKIDIDEKYDISFDEIKNLLKKQYEKLGFTNIKLDKEDSWLLKNPDIEKAYVLLTHKNSSYVIETFNIDEKPILKSNL